MGKLVLGPAPDGVEVDGRPRLEHKGGDNGFSARIPRIFGHSDDGDVAHSRHPLDRLFDLRRIDVETAVDDELLCPVRHHEEAVVPVSQVARAEPAVFGEGLGRLLGVVVIADEDLRAADQNFAGASIRRGGRVVRGGYAHLSGGERQPERRGAASRGNGRARDDRAGLRHPVPLDDEASRGVFPPGGQFAVERHGARKGEADAAQVLAAFGCGVQNAGEHGGDAGKQRDASAAIGGKKRVRIEFRQQDEGGAQLDAQHRRHHSKSVEKGENAAEHLVAPGENRNPGFCLLDVRSDVPVGEHDCFRLARRAAGVNEDGDVVNRRWARIAARPRLSDEVVEGGHARRHGSPELRTLFLRRSERQLEKKARKVGKFAREVDRQENGAAERPFGGQRLEGLLPHDCRPRASLRYLFAQLLWRRKRIVLGHRRAERENGEKCDDVLRAVGHDERDDVAAAHP